MLSKHVVKSLLCLKYNKYPTNVIRICDLYLLRMINCIVYDLYERVILRDQYAWLKV